jgi:O-antigen ligase
MNMSWNRMTNGALLFLIGVLPLGLFTIKGWASGILFICATLSLVNIITYVGQPDDKGGVHQEKFWQILILLALTLPLISVMISSGLRGQWIWADFDAQSRFFMGALIFYAVLRNGLDPFRYLQYSIPVGLILTILSTAFLPGYYGGAINVFDGSRLAIYFVDPLTLGYLSLTLGVLSFFSIHLFSKDRWYVVALKLVGAALGLYISLKTQSRTGWLAIPFIVFLALWLHGPKNKIKSSAIALAFSLTLTIGIYQASPTVQNRVGAAVADLRDYRFDKVNAESSIGERISFARMAFYYFKLNPLSGWGHKGYQVHINDPELVAFATFNTRNAPGSGALFHSEIATNSVAFGILGFIYTILLFFAPLALMIQSWRLGKNPRLCAFGIAYMLCALISSFSTEIFALKFAASFHAVFIASICGQVLNGRYRDH